MERLEQAVFVEAGPAGLALVAEVGRVLAVVGTVDRVVGTLSGWSMIIGPGTT